MAYNMCISWGPNILNLLCIRMFYMAHYYEGRGRADLKVLRVPTDAGAGDRDRFERVPSSTFSRNINSLT